MMRNSGVSLATALVLLIALFWALAAWAEPYLAVREGLACSACHVNPTGAGLRTPFGNAYAQQTLPDMPASEPTWTGSVLERFALGANARFAARQTELDDRDDNLEFGVDRASLYLGVELVPPVSLYLDQQVAPGGSLNREAWARLEVGEWYLKAGRLFLPLGWRLEDDTAFVRQVTGVSMEQGDDGLEIGLERPGLSWQLAVTNGNGGGAEADDGKLFSTRAALIRSRWQAGLSVLRNDTDRTDRTVVGAFAGLRTGPVTWLAEYDHVDEDADDGGQEEQAVGLLEANLRLQRGHNLKVTAEGHWFDGDRDDRYRFSGVYEYFPWAFTQVRLGVRARDSDSPAAEENGEEAFLQLHVFF